MLLLIVGLNCWLICGGVVTTVGAAVRSELCALFNRSKTFLQIQARKITTRPPRTVMTISSCLRFQSPSQSKVAGDQLRKHMRSKMFLAGTWGRGDMLREKSTS